ncbi:MAG: hypothetical protein ABEI06_05435 [Halobacteriaceae archaeon]
MAMSSKTEQNTSFGWSVIIAMIILFIVLVAGIWFMATPIAGM